MFTASPRPRLHLPFAGMVSIFSFATVSVANLPDYVHMGNTFTVTGSLTSCPGQFH